MNDEKSNTFNDGAEMHTASEVVADHDVLSHSSRGALEQVGSATGFVLALALVCALLPRAARVHAVGPTPPRATTPSMSGADGDTRASLRPSLDAARGDQPSGGIPIECEGSAERAGGGRRV